MIDPARLEAGARGVYGDEMFDRVYGQLIPVDESRVRIMEDGDELTLGNRQLHFIDTPGHARHHFCVHDSLTNGWFTGDTFGLSYREFDTKAGPLLIAPPTPVAFDPDAWQRSIDKIMGFAPKAVYLTHYCKVENPKAVEQQLRQSIRDLAAIALAEENSPQGRVDRLRKRISTYMIDRVQGHGCDMDEARILDLLGMDIELDAQGLEVWLVRREKKAAENSSA
jgi:glyoxylase-like metal-dependent hydrolase (beta-lactamase superfamily II)